MSGLFDILSQRSDALDKLKKLKTRSQNQDAQEKLDKKYTALANEGHLLVQVLTYARSELQFTPDNDTLVKLQTLLADLLAAPANGDVEEDTVTKCEKTLRDVKEGTKKAWNKFYPGYVAETLSTLQIVKGINATKVADCQTKIEAAKVWSPDIEVYKSLAAAMAQATELIATLGLDDDIVTFLQQMNAGKATLTSINSKVQAWLKKEMLENSIKLTFITK